MLSFWWVYLPSSEIYLCNHSFIQSFIYLCFETGFYVVLGTCAVQPGVRFRTVLLSAGMTGFCHETHFLSIGFNLIIVKNHSDKGKLVLSVHYLKQSWIALDTQATRWERALWQVLGPSCLHLLSTYCSQCCLLSAAPLLHMAFPVFIFHGLSSVGNAWNSSLPHFPLCSPTAPFLLLPSYSSNSRKFSGSSRILSTFGPIPQSP